MIKFGEWLPDQPALNNPGVFEAKNVIPAAGGYRCFKRLSAVSAVADEIILSMHAGKDDAGNHVLYVGDSGKLYRFSVADGSLTDKSKAGGYGVPVGDVWRFAQFGESLIAVNGPNGDALQTTTVGGVGTFDDLAGSPPKAAFIAVVRDQVMVAKTFDSIDGVKPYRIWFSRINDHTGWTPGTGMADYQDVPDAGDCTGLVGGQYGIALFERAIVRATFVGAPAIYQFDRLTNARGCTVPGSVASVGSALVFFLSDDGFYMLRNDEIIPIGAEKINRWFLDRFQAEYRSNVCAGIDPLNQNVVWAYPSIDSAGGANDEILVYNYNLNRWSYGEQACTAVSQLMTSAYTLEELDAAFGTNVDALTTGLDSIIYQGGSFFFAGAEGKKIASFSGLCRDATIETGEFAVAAGRRSLINNVLPYVVAGVGQTPTIKAQIGSRARQNDQPTFVPTSPDVNGSPISSEGYCAVRALGAYHRVRLNMTGEFEIAQGVDVDIQPAGMR